ncbi:MAG: c-type cytochrome biogenesis protein CcmI [Sulfuricella sp.]|nr:c-type cytochrome biogenesis protein CcmI [Sulfuricella sp.]
MINFWTLSLFAASFLALIGAALAFVLPPLLRRNPRLGQVDGKETNIAIYRDQLAELQADLDSGELAAQQYEEARREIEKRLSQDVPRESAAESGGPAGRWAGYALTLAIPVLAGAMYLVLGNPGALLTPPPGAEADERHDVAPLLASLEAKLKKQPDNAEGWAMLGRSYAALGRFDEAARAMAQAAARLPDDPRVLADYAEALAMTQGGNLHGKPLELIGKALKLDGKDEKALSLAGAAAYQDGKFAEAAAYWRRLLNVMPKDADDYRQIADAAEKAEQAARSSPDKAAKNR